MARTEHVTYSCDMCGGTLKSFLNQLNIRTSVYETSAGWSRLHVRIEHIHGLHNTAKTEYADLCKTCTMNLLNDAIKRVSAGERATEGTEEIQQGRWE